MVMTTELKRIDEHSEKFNKVLENIKKKKQQNWGIQYSKSLTYKWVLFQEHFNKSNLFNKVSLGTQLTYSAI